MQQAESEIPERKMAPSALIVEDEFLIASALQLLLEKQGVRVHGPVGRVSAALELASATPHLDCALLDVRLGDESVFPVADRLRARGVRFAFLSGYDRSVLPDTYRDVRYFSKLEDPEALLRWVLGANES